MLWAILVSFCFPHTYEDFPNFVSLHLYNVHFENYNVDMKKRVIPLFHHPPPKHFPVPALGQQYVKN